MRDWQGAKQKNFPQSTELEKQDSDKKCAYLDLAWTKEKGGKRTVKWPYWRMLMDGLMNLRFSKFFHAKNDMAEPTIDILRMDNAGENKLLDE